MSKVLDVFYEDRYCEVCKSNNEHLIQKVDEEDNGEYVGYYAECLICNNVEDITFPNYEEDKIKSYVNSLVSSNIVKGFKIEAIVKEIEGVTEKEVEDVLDEYVKKGVLEKEYEICCSNCFSVISSSTEKEIENKRRDIDYCWHCDNEIDSGDTYLTTNYVIKKI